MSNNPFGPPFPVQSVYYPPGYNPQQPASYPQPPYPSSGQMARATQQTVLGAPEASMLRDDPQFAEYQKVPAFYTVSIQLGGNAGDFAAENVKLRPEAFICERITWACNERPANYSAGTGSAGVALSSSPQGRSVAVSWGDEFTRFLNQTPCLISALFGDSDGYLNLPRGILFQGSQALNVRLDRISNPLFDQQINLELRFDFNFQGVGLLPKNVAQSGSAG